jgi:hypothetical protein
VECLHTFVCRRHNGDVTRLRPLIHFALTPARGSENDGNGLTEELFTSVSGAVLTFQAAGDGFSTRSSLLMCAFASKTKRTKEAETPSSLTL